MISFILAMNKILKADIIAAVKPIIIAAICIAAGGLVFSQKNSNSEPLYENKQELLTYKLTDVEIVKNKTKETTVDISKYNLLITSGETSTIKEFETAYTGGTFILENGQRIEIEEVRHSAKITEPELKTTYTYEKLVDNKGVKDAQEIKNEYYKSGALILPMNVKAMENEAQETE